LRRDDNGEVTIAILLAAVGLILSIIGFSRGNMAAVVIGSVLMADALLFYVELGPAAAASRLLFHPS
jgi:hypothetical protein